MAIHGPECALYLTKMGEMMSKFYRVSEMMSKFYEVREHGRKIEIVFEVCVNEQEEMYDWVALPAHWEVCWYCEGTGRSSAYLGAFTREDMDELGPKFMEDYFDGAYDKPCPECDGNRVVAVPAEREFLSKEKQVIFDEFQRQAKEEADFEALSAAERRMGA